MKNYKSTEMGGLFILDQASFNSHRVWCNDVTLKIIIYNLEVTSNLDDDGQLEVGWPLSPMGYGLIT